MCSQKAIGLIRQFHHADPREVLPVKEGDTLCTGRHTFSFHEAPMVHWPEVVVSYDQTDKILFSADAFGTFGALNGILFADEVTLTGTGWTRPGGITPTSWASTAPRSRPC